MHHQGDLDGSGSNWAYVEGGMGMVSFAIADAAREAGAALACGVPVARDRSPARGSSSRTGRGSARRTVICNADPKVALRLLGAEAIDAVDPAYRERLEAWDVRSPVVKFNAALDRLPDWTAAEGESWPARAMIELTDGIDAAQDAFERCARRRAGGRLRRGLHADRLRPEPGARGQALDERVRPVRALRASPTATGTRAARRSPASSSS